MSDLEAILRWYVALTIIAAALFPLVVWLGARLGAAAYGLLRPLSLVGLTAIVWWPAAVLGLPFNRWSLLAALVLIGGVGWWTWTRQSIEPVNWRVLLAFESLWLVMFLGYAWFRSYQPDIINTEKPMEIALLTSVSRSSEVPAPDPWFAGSAINYYYFGFQTFATAINLSGVPAAIGFNLALASLFASCATTAASAGAVLVRGFGASRKLVVTGAALAVVLLLVAGNLETARRLVDDRQATVDAGWWDGVGWNASRIIYDDDVPRPGDVSQTINEFPAFSFVLGDLHPHVLTYPLLAAVLVLALGIAFAAGRESWSRLAVTGALVGLLYASNSWDAPAGLLLVLGALAVGSGFDWKQILRGSAIVMVSAVVMAAPFVLHFDAPIGVANADVPAWIRDLPLLGQVFSTFAIVDWRPSSARELLIVHGAWLAAFVAFAALQLRQRPELVAGLRRRPEISIVVGILAFGVAMAWAPAVLLLGVPLLLAGWLAIRADQRAVQVIAGLFACGFLLALIPEFFYIQDVFANRMNTVFKLFYQAWLILSIASAAAIVITVREIPRLYRVPGVFAAILLVAATLPYTPLSAQDWTNDFAERRGLDGAAYIGRNSPGDLAAIEWIAEHAEDGDTIVETPGCSYLNAGGAPYNRVSAFSGVPTIVGWLGHEVQWRRGEFTSVREVVDARALQAKAMLDGVMPADQSSARFVILGRQELQAFPDCEHTSERGAGASAALEAAGWQVAFTSGDTRVFVRSDDRLVADFR